MIQRWRSARRLGMKSPNLVCPPDRPSMGFELLLATCLWRLEGNVGVKDGSAEAELKQRCYTTLHKPKTDSLSARDSDIPMGGYIRATSAFSAQLLLTRIRTTQLISLEIRSETRTAYCREHCNLFPQRIFFAFAIYMVAAISMLRFPQCTAACL